MEEYLRDLPVVRGSPDAKYLQAALARAGRVSNIGAVNVTPLDGGRTSMPVMSLRSASGGAYVVKIFSRHDWRAGLLGHRNVEVELWTSGVTRELPSPVTCPTIDVAQNSERDEWWMLMDDVSSGIMQRDAFDEGRIHWLLKALARLHARYWGRTAELAAMPLIPLELNVAMIVEPVIAIGGRTEAVGWVKTAIEKFVILKPFVPVLLEMIGSNDAEFYLDICQHRDGWLHKLASCTSTMVHGDIRRSNVALLSADKISLFDWDFATRGPAAVDMLWYWFLQFWAYPPNDGRTIEERDALREFYRSALADAIRGPLDRAEFDLAWDLAWLKVFTQIGCVLVDPIVGKHTDAELARVRAVCRKAVDHAKRICDTYVQ